MNALIFLIESLSHLYMLTFLLRLMLQVARGDFYSPVAQFIVQITNPLVVPARRIIPSVRSFDLPTLVVLFVLQLVVIVIVLSLRGIALRIDTLLWLTIFDLARLAIGTYLFCILIWVVLSWIGQTWHPISVFLGQLIAPVLRPARRMLPATGAIDVSPLITSIFLWAALILLADLRTLVL